MHKLNSFYKILDFIRVAIFLSAIECKQFVNISGEDYDIIKKKKKAPYIYVRDYFMRLFFLIKVIIRLGKKESDVDKSHGSAL